MRITHNMMARRSMVDIEAAYKKLSDASYSFSTGKKHENAHDDPIAANILNRIKSDKKDIAKYYSNIDNATSAINDMEMTLKDTNSCMQKILELFNNANNATISPSAKEFICNEIQQYKEQIITNLNYSSSGICIFGGFNTKSAPITFNSGAYHYNGINISLMTPEQISKSLGEKVTVNINKGMSMDIRISALEIMGSGPGNLLNNIDSIISLIRADEFNSESYTALNKVFEGNYDRILTNITKIGVAANRLSSVKSQLNSREATLKDRISDIEDIDAEKAILNYKLAEHAYEASLAASASAIQLSLLDFLR